MRKRQIILLSLLASLTGSLFVNTNNAKVAHADQEIVDTQVGPGVLNTRFATTQNPDSYKLHLRDGGATWWLLLFPNNCDYDGESPTQFVASQYVEDNFKKIKIYSNENNFVTASSIISTTSTLPIFNQMSDACCNIGISLGNSFRANNVYKIVIEQGFVYPNLHEETTCKYMQSESQSFINNHYNKSNTENYGDWAVEKLLSGDEEIIPAYIGYNSQRGGNRNYCCHMRSAGMEGNGDCYLLFFFDTTVYNQDIKGVYSVGVNTKYLNRYNFFDKVLLHQKSNGVTLTLREVLEGKELNCFYNIWGENESFAIEIGNESNRTGSIDYAPNAFDYIIVEHGAEFPAYATTNGDSTKLIKYVQNQTIKMVDNKNDPITNDLYYLNFSLGNTNVESVSVKNENVTIDGQEVNKPFVVLKLDNYDTDTTKTDGFLISEILLSKIYVNGKTIKSNNGNKTKIIHNIDGEKTFGFSVENLTIDQIMEVIIRNACELPSANNSESGFKIYKTGSCYVTQESVCFSRSNSAQPFTRSTSEIKWCLWFGDECVKIQNNRYFYYPDDLPADPVKENAEFVCWTYLDGSKLDADFRVKDSVEFVPYFIYYYHVTLHFDDSTKTLSVQDGDRLTDLDVPYKKGYIFSHWTDKDGNFYNIDNSITKDIDIYAVYVVNENANGCKSSVVTCSSLICLLSISGAALLIKRKED